MNELTKLAKLIDFGDIVNQELRDQIIAVIKNRKRKKKVNQSCKQKTEKD